MTNITDKNAGAPEKYNVKIPNLSGYLAFYRISPSTPWCLLMPQIIPGAASPVNCPNPLFQTKNAAVQTVKSGWYEEHDVELMIFEIKE